MVFFQRFPQNSSTTPLDTPETEGIILKCSKRNDPAFEHIIWIPWLDHCWTWVFGSCTDVLCSKKHLECGSIDSESSFFYHKVSRDLKSRWNPSIYFWISHISEHTALHNSSHDRGCFNRIWSPNGFFKHQNNGGIEFFLSQTTHRLHISLESVYLILVFSH